MIDLKEKSVIVCSIVRDAEKGLRRNIPVIKEFCRGMGDYKVVVFENDSHDKTKDLLKAWVEQDSERVFAFMADSDGEPTIPSFNSVNVNPFFGHKRIDRMAALRNQYMDFLWSRGWKADYLMVVDLDVANINLKGILSSFSSDKEWDAVTAFGYSLGPTMRNRYHDTYALTLYGDDTPQTEQKISDMQNQMASVGDGNQWIRVASAFGGLAIYRMEAVCGLRYEVLENNDSRVEVLCEHYGLHRKMHERGYDRIYINPQMKIKYQEIDFKFVLKYLKNMREKRMAGNK